MRNKLEKTLLIIIAIVGLVTLTGCNKTTKTKTNNKTNEIVGSWKYQGSGDYIYTFKEDGTGTYKVGSTTMEFTYKTEGKKLSITYKGNTEPFETEYSIKNNVLNVVDSLGNDTLYNKK